MRKTRVVKGENVTVEEFFKDDNGTPLNFTKPVRLRIFDFNNAHVTSTIAAQDVHDLTRWTADFSIPSNAPTGEEGQQYRMSWAGNTDQGLVKVESFFTLASNADFNIEEDVKERIAIQGSKFSDSLVIPAFEQVEEIRIEVVNIFNTILYEAEINPNPISSNSTHQLFKHTSETAINGKEIPALNAAPVQVNWYVTIDGEEVLTQHYLYLVTPKLMELMRKIRVRIDKARNIPHDPALAFYDTDLLAYIDLGLARLNAHPPTITGYTFSMLPSDLDYPLIECCVYEALRAQALAEGQSQFSFSGQAVTLDMDRVASIETEIGRIEAYLSENLKTVKRLFIRRGGSSGMLGVNYGSLNFNWMPPISLAPYWHSRFYGLAGGGMLR